MNGHADFGVNAGSTPTPPDVNALICRDLRVQYARQTAAIRRTQ